MKVMINLSHPSHHYIFKNFYLQMIEKGHQIKFITKEKEELLKLMDTSGIPYEIFGYHHHKTKFNRYKDFIMRYIRIYKISKKFQPDMIIGILNTFSTHIGFLQRIPTFVFTDSETVQIGNILTFPFSKHVVTPFEYSIKLNKKKHMKLKTYKELAYLHPNYYNPNPNILNELGIDKGDKYVILRFGAFDAAHDLGINGFSIRDKERLINELEKYCKIFISSETSLPDKFKKYKFSLPPEKMHDALYYASLLVGDTGTMTTESACLGTPAICFHPSIRILSNFVELEEKYGLIYGFDKAPNKAIEKAVELIKKPNLKQEWKKKKEKLLSDKIDFTSFMVWFVENYPKSYQIMKENPEYQNKFK